MKRLVERFDAGTARTVVIISSVFCLILIAGMLWLALANKPMEHFDRKDFLETRESLLKEPGNIQLQQQAREIDLRLRQSYFDSRVKLRIGGFLLLIFSAILLLSIKRLATLTEKPAMPVNLKEQPNENRIIPAALCLFLLSVFGSIAAILFMNGSESVEKTIEPSFSQGEVVQESETVEIADIPQTPLVKRWSQIRGNSGNGLADTTLLPDSWNGESGENILWKSQVPDSGKSSPVIWEDKIFVTGWNESARSVYCFSLEDGSLLWSCNAKTEAVSKQFEAMAETGLAAPTATTDGQKVYAYFGSNELVAVDYEGNQVWGKWFGEPQSMYGLASSPVLFQGRLYLQLDQGDVEDGLSRVYCINPNDGEVVWSMPRDVNGSWSSPLGFKHDGGEQVVLASNPWVIAYHPETGRELWRADVLSGDVAPIPCFGKGTVFTTTEYSQLAAIGVDGSGDVTQSHVFWSYDEELPDVASPVTDGDFILVPTAYGTVNCLDAKTGETVWTEDFYGGFWSSPIMAGDRVYLTDMDGTTYIFKYRGGFELLQECPLGEQVVTIPAFVDNNIVFRTEEHLVCVAMESIPEEVTDDSDGG